MRFRRHTRAEWVAFAIGVLLGTVLIHVAVANASIKTPRQAAETAAGLYLAPILAEHGKAALKSSPCHKDSARWMICPVRLTGELSCATLWRVREGKASWTVYLRRLACS